MSRRDLSIMRQPRAGLADNETEVPLEPDDPIIKTFGSFGKGLILGLNPEELPKDACAALTDMTILPNGRLSVALGIAIDEVLSVTPVKSVVHTSLDQSSELVLIAPPYIGVKSTGSVTWYDIGLPTNNLAWNTAMYADVLLVSDGASKVYSRNIGDTTLTEVVGMPAGKTMTVFNARVFVANAMINGIQEPMGIAWNNDTGLYTDWGGVGSGSELLIYDFSHTDYIVALRPMSLDLMSILCRKSIWIAARTTDPNEPADISPRLTGSGCVNEKTAWLIPGGVIYLSDKGVMLFDGNTSNIISEAINDQLLPLAEDSKYSATYDATSAEYQLFTPSATWVFNLEFQRWEKRTAIIDEGFDFPNQVGAIAWSAATGTWNDAAEASWADMGNFEGESRMMFRAGKNLGVYSRAVQTFFGNAMFSLWQSPVDVGPELDTVVTTNAIRLRYVGDATIVIQLPDIYGNMRDVVTKKLPRSFTPDVADISMLSSGVSMGVGIRVLDGRLDIMRVQSQHIVRNTRIGGI